MSSSLLVSLPSMKEVSPSLLNAAHPPSIPCCKEATFAPFFLKKDTTSVACRQPEGSSGTTPWTISTPVTMSSALSTQPYALARCILALTFLVSPPLSSWSKKAASDFAASALDLKTCLMILRVGGRRLRADVTGGSSSVGGAMVFCKLSPWAAGVVYCERAARDRSQRFGAQTPTNTRHAATSRLALVNKTVSKHTLSQEIVQGAYCS